MKTSLDTGGCSITTETRKSINKKRIALAVEISDLACGCLQSDIAELINKRCPCGDACKGVGNTHVENSGHQDDNCPCDPHCGLCCGVCSHSNHVVYSSDDPFLDVDFGPRCPDLCAHAHVIVKRYVGEHCPRWCEMAARTKKRQRGAGASGGGAR